MPWDFLHLVALVHAYLPPNWHRFTAGRPTMIDMETIRAAAARLVAAATSPARVILFGSYARGTADEGSDLDLMVIEQEVPDKAAEYMRLMEAVGRVAPGVGLDLLIYPMSEYERRGQVPGTVLFEARVEGQVLHDALQ
jgi:predicted nucleotidyltransferase